MGRPSMGMRYLGIPSLEELMLDVALIREALPETWTHIDNVNWLRVGFTLKLAGLDWRSLPGAIVRLQQLGLLQRDGYLIRRSNG